MTSAIGPVNIETDNGFTLVELLIVCVILGVLLGGTVPLFRGSFRGASLRRAALDVASTLRHARSCAVGEERAWQVTFDKAAGAYWTTGFSDPKEMEGSAADDEGAAKRKLPKDVLISSATYPSSGDRFAIAFYPDGSSKAGEIRLGVGGSDADAATVRVATHDGGVSLSEGAP